MKLNCLLFFLIFFSPIRECNAIRYNAVQHSIQCFSVSFRFKTSLEGRSQEGTKSKELSKNENEKCKIYFYFYFN